MQPDCEWLEGRSLLSADSVAASVSQITAQTSLQVLAVNSTTPTGLTPEKILKAYGISGIPFAGGTISGNGAGQTIAIVDAYDDPNISSDLAAFDAAFGLSSPPSFTVANLGATTTDAGWSLETALDVEWAHAIAPEAKIVLVEASSDSLSALFNAVSYASNLAGVSVVSMSWGTGEFTGETQYNSVFTTPAGHENVMFVAASGDSGAYSGPEYPSVAPDVLAVGGTTLSVSSDGTYLSESGWSGSTGGFSGLDSSFSSFVTEPAYQTSTLKSVGLSYGMRTTPDASFNADPSTGVSVYDSVAYDGQSGWFQIGGTSAAAPSWAGLVAIVDQGLATGGVGTLSTTQLLNELYSLPSSDFNDITSGSNGYSATTGYDLVTGLGTPRSSQLVAGLLAANGVSASSTTTTSSTSSTTPVTGSSGSTVTTTGSTGTTTPTPSPTSTKHHVTHVQKTKTRSHITKVKKTKAKTTKATQKKVQHTSLRSASIVASESDTASPTASVSSAGVATEVPSNSSSAALGTTTSSSSVHATSTPAAIASVASVMNVSSNTTSVGQSLANSSLVDEAFQITRETTDRSAGDQSQSQPIESVTDLATGQLAVQVVARGPSVHRAAVVENVRPWPPLDHEQSSSGRSLDEFDVAIAHLGEHSLTRLFEPPTNYPDAASGDRPGSGISTLLGTVAVTVGGYRLSLRDSRSRRSGGSPRL